MTYTICLLDLNKYGWTSVCNPIKEVKLSSSQFLSSMNTSLWMPRADGLRNNGVGNVAFGGLRSEWKKMLWIVLLTLNEAWSHFLPWWLGIISGLMSSTSGGSPDICGLYSNNFPFTRGVVMPLGSLGCCLFSKWQSGRIDVCLSNFSEEFLMKNIPHCGYLKLKIQQNICLSQLTYSNYCNRMLLM